MLKKYDYYISLLKYKLQKIGFYLENENIESVTFGNGTKWKVILEGDRFLESAPSYNIIIKREVYPDIGTNRIEFSLIILMKIYITNPIFGLENMIDFLIENKDKIFDETFPYKEAYDKLNGYRGQFWDKFNKSFLDKAIERDDDIVLATKPDPKLFTNIKGEQTGFGREYQYLNSKGYVYDAQTNKMTNPLK